MTSGLDDYTKKLLDRTRARNEALQQKMQERSFQNKKRRPLEVQETNVSDSVSTASTIKEKNIDEKNGVESPKKRSRLEDQDLARNEVPMPATSLKPEKSIGERMQKLLNQRKQWEAADHGDEVDFENVPSPLHHGQVSPAASLQSCRKVDIERKARLAAFAKEINSREDDLSHSKVASSNNDVSLSSEKISQETGRKTPMSEVYRSETVLNEPSDPSTKGSTRPPRIVSQRVSLSIETLSQFAHKEKESSSIPAKSLEQKKLPRERFAVDTFNKKESDVIGHQVTPTSKTLQQRLIELQKNGCNAKRSTVGNKQASANTEVQRLKNEGDSLIDDDHLADDGNIATDTEEKAVEEADKGDDCDSMGVSAEARQENSISDQLKPSVALNTTGTSKRDKDADESGLSFGDSMMEELDANQAVTDDESSFLNEAATEESYRSSYGSDVEDVDDLFDGVSHIEDDVMSSPIISDISNKGKATLTRQKSRLEIKSELVVRKQTCNEAEDTHAIRRNPSRQLRPLARSSSIESIVSLGAEKAELEMNVPVYTIDSYRMEKRKSLRSVDKKIVRNENVRPKSDDVTHKSRISAFKERNSQLLDEVQKQQRVIQQASAALNCCYDVHHGKGSITELEAEKLLLVASEKRLALLAEIQRLKTSSCEEMKPGFKPCQGSLTIENIQLPLRTEYIFSMASKKDGGETPNHYYFILVRNGPRKIFATHLASTHDHLSADSLLFKDKFTFDALESDFEVCIEVYTVNHRNRAFGAPSQEKSKKKITGIIQKSKAVGVRRKLGAAFEKTRQKVRQVGDSATCSLIRPRDDAKEIDSLTPRKHKARSIHASIPASPGGPNAVRSSSFTPIGSVTIRLNDVKKSKFILQKVPFLSPISGQLGCKISTDFKSDVEQRGFLTTFHDVGGMGAWHRRWCCLRDGVLFSWTYPDDEKHKEALSKLELRQCISRDVRIVERIMCARPNTFELRTMRPRKEGDKVDLISQDTGSVITTRHWLAADTKEERALWVESFNQSLADVRSWDLTSLKPLS